MSRKKNKQQKVSHQSSDKRKVIFDLIEFLFEVNIM